MIRSLSILCAAGLLSATLIAGCGTNRPVKEETLADEASRYARNFERDMKLGRYHAALDDAGKALAVNRILDQDVGIAVSLNNLGAVQERVGLPDAEQTYREAVTFSREAGAARVLAVSLNNLSGVLVQTRPDQARALAQEALDIARSNSWTAIETRAVHNMCRAELESGETGQSMALCRQALDLATETGERGTQAACLVTLGRVESLTGSGESAERRILEALAIDRERADPYAIAMDYVRLAEVQDRAGNAEEAERSRERAEEIMGILGIPSPGERK